MEAHDGWGDGPGTNPLVRHDIILTGSATGDAVPLVVGHSIHPPRDDEFEFDADQ